MLIGCAVISSLVLVVVNCIYYGANYHTMETNRYVKTRIIKPEDVELKIRQDSIIRIVLSGNCYNVKVKSSNTTVVLDTINRVTTIKDDFVGDNKWLMISSYPNKNTYYNIGLNEKNYDIFKTYQDSICKRKNTLSKNG